MGYQLATFIVFKPLYTFYIFKYFPIAHQDELYLKARDFSLM